MAIPKLTRLEMQPLGPPDSGVISFERPPGLHHRANARLQARSEEGRSPRE
jgi:hypothetical protein